MEQEIDLCLDYGWWLRMRQTKAGVFYINGAIGQGTTATLMNELRYASEYNAHFTFYLNSPGGEVEEALALYDLIRTTEKPTVVALGLAASAASMIILQAGDERLATPHTRFMLHEVSQFMRGFVSTSQSEDSTKEMKALQTYALGILSQRTGRSVAAISRMVKRKDVWMNTEEALKWNLIDGITTGLPGY